MWAPPRIASKLMPRHTLWSDAASAPLSRERLLAATPCEHPLLEQEALEWKCLRRETLLVRGVARIARAKPSLAGRLHRAMGTRCHHP
jgi:hypothetical protein